MKEKKCIFVTGPTASGKTDLAVEIALRYRTSIISADSRQCYRELEIGVAKPARALLQKIPHYFIGSHSITEEVNTKIFEEYALSALGEIFSTRDIAVVVGGTGLYIKALAMGLDELPAVDPSLRKEITTQYQEMGKDWLVAEVRSRDPLYFQMGEVHNPQRMMRALEVMRSTGRSILEFQTGKQIKRDFIMEQVHLDIPREILYQRIHTRVDHMIEAGLVKEVEGLYPYRHLNALQTVGYQEIFPFLEGKISLAEAIESIKKNTRHYAKRQMTWFRRFQMPSTQE